MFVTQPTSSISAPHCLRPLLHWTWSLDQIKSPGLARLPGQGRDKEQFCGYSWDRLGGEKAGEQGERQSGLRALILDLLMQETQQRTPRGTITKVLEEEVRWYAPCDTAAVSGGKVKLHELIR